MKRTIVLGLAGIAALAIMFWAGRCEGRSEARLDAAGDTTDAQRTRLATRVAELETQIRRDSATHVARQQAAADSTEAARRTADSLEAALRARGTLSPDVVATLDAKNAVIASLARDTVVKRQAITFWQAVAATRAAQRDSALALADDYRRQRDDWRKKARSACGPDVGGGYGLTTRAFDAWVGYGCRIPFPRLPFM